MKHFLLFLCALLAGCAPIAATDVGQTADLGLGPVSTGGGPTDPSGATTSATSATLLISSGGTWQPLFLSGDVITGGGHGPGIAALVNSPSARSDLGLGTGDNVQFNGGTFNSINDLGFLVVGDGVSAHEQQEYIRTDNGDRATLYLETVGVPRWGITKDSTAEAGGDGGSPWSLEAYSDAGTLIDRPINIVRATGGTINIGGLARPITVSGGTDFILNTTTGTRFGTGSSQKLSFYGAPAIVRPTGDVITALQNLGLGASLTVTATTDANLTGPITSVGNATSIASQTGTGSKFVVDASPTIQGLTNCDPSDNTKTMGWTLSGATASTKLTLISSQTANRSATVPTLAANDTFGMLGQTQTWTGPNTFAAATASSIVDSGALTATGATILAGAVNIEDATDATKKITFDASSQTTNTTETFKLGAGVGAILTFPVGATALGGLATNQTWTGQDSFSNGVGIVVSGAAGFKSTGATTTVQGVSGAAQFYRTSGTIAPAGSAIIQTDIGQAGAGVYFFTGTTPATACSITTTGTFTATGSIICEGTGNGLKVPTAANGKMGTATLSGGTVTVANTSVTANSFIFLTDTNSGGVINVGSLAVTAKSANTSFTVTSTNVADTSTFNWFIVEPSP